MITSEGGGGGEAGGAGGLTVLLSAGEHVALEVTHTHTHTVATYNVRRLVSFQPCILRLHCIHSKF